MATTRSNTISSHAINVTPSSSMTSKRVWQEFPKRMTFSGDFSEMIVEPKEEPYYDEPVSIIRKSRSFFRTYSSGSLHKLINEVVVPTYSLEYMKILPPPSYIYMKTVHGNYIYKEVYLNRKGNRYIFDENMNKVYLQDIKGLYRYNSA